MLVFQKNEVVFSKGDQLFMFLILLWTHGFTCILCISMHCSYYLGLCLNYPSLSHGSLLKLTPMFFLTWPYCYLTWLLSHLPEIGGFKLHRIFSFQKEKVLEKLGWVGHPNLTSLCNLHCYLVRQGILGSSCTLFAPDLKLAICPRTPGSF